jgi:hypothetical protein
MNVMCRDKRECCENKFCSGFIFRRPYQSPRRDTGLLLFLFLLASEYYTMEYEDDDLPYVKEENAYQIRVESELVCRVQF